MLLLLPASRASNEPLRKFNNGREGPKQIEPSPGWKCSLELSHLRHFTYAKQASKHDEVTFSEIVKSSQNFIWSSSSGWEGQDQDRRQAEAGRKSDLRLLCGNRIGSRMKRKHWTFKIISWQFETFSWQDLVGMFNYSVIFSNTSRLGYFSSIFMFQCFQLNGQWQGPAWCLALVMETAGYSARSHVWVSTQYGQVSLPYSRKSGLWEAVNVTCHVPRVTPAPASQISVRRDVGDMRKCLIHVYNQSENQQTMSNNNHPKIMKTEWREVWCLSSYFSTCTNRYLLYDIMTWQIVIKFGSSGRLRGLNTV